MSTLAEILPPETEDPYHVRRNKDVQHHTYHYVIPPQSATTLKTRADYPFVGRGLIPLTLTQRLFWAFYWPNATPLTAYSVVFFRQKRIVFQQPLFNENGNFNTLGAYASGGYITTGNGSAIYEREVVRFQSVNGGAGGFLCPPFRLDIAADEIAFSFDQQANSAGNADGFIRCESWSGL